MAFYLECGVNTKVPWCLHWCFLSARTARQKMTNTVGCLLEFHSLFTELQGKGET